MGGRPPHRTTIRHLFVAPARFNFPLSSNLRNLVTLSSIYLHRQARQFLQRNFVTPKCPPATAGLYFFSAFQLARERDFDARMHHSYFFIEPRLTKEIFSFNAEALSFVRSPPHTSFYSHFYARRHFSPLLFFCIFLFLLEGLVCVEREGKLRRMEWENTPTV